MPLIIITNIWFDIVLENGAILSCIIEIIKKQVKYTRLFMRNEVYLDRKL